MMNHYVLVTTLILAVSLQAPVGQKTAGPASATEAGWTPLFNGRDFTGWRISKPESFKVENGAIAGTVARVIRITTARSWATRSATSS